MIIANRPRGVRRVVPIAPRTREAAAVIVHARFRFALRRFLRFSEDQARALGITSVQHQMLLALRSSRRGWLSVGGVARAMLIQPHSGVGLIDRAVRDGLVYKQPDPGDLRRVRVRLTPRGATLIAELTAAHRPELQRLWRLVPNLR